MNMEREKPGIKISTCDQPNAGQFYNWLVNVTHLTDEMIRLWILILKEWLIHKKIVILASE